MKAADNLRARLGANILESMGAGRPASAPPAFTPPPALHGETAKYQGAARIKDALSIDVSRIVPDPDQPRKEFDPKALEELAASLKARGQLQPIRVRWSEDAGKWIIVVGERRYRAALLAGLPTLVCIEAKGSPTPDDILEDQLVENALRVDLAPVEQARAYKALIDRRGWSYRQLAESLHIAPASVARALALLELPQDLQERVEAGQLAPSVAYEVSRVEGPERQRELAAKIADEGLSRAEASEVIRATAGKPSKGKSRGAAGKAKRATCRVIRVAGFKITVENRRGIDSAALHSALLEAAAMAKVDAEGEGRDAA